MIKVCTKNLEGIVVRILRNVKPFLFQKEEITLLNRPFPSYHSIASVAVLLLPLNTEAFLERTISILFDIAQCKCLWWRSFSWSVPDTVFRAWPNEKWTDEFYIQRDSCIEEQNRRRGSANRDNYSRVHYIHFTQNWTKRKVREKESSPWGYRIIRNYAGSKQVFTLIFVQFLLFFLCFIRSKNWHFWDIIIDDFSKSGLEKAALNWITWEVVARFIFVKNPH